MKIRNLQARVVAVHLLGDEEDKQKKVVPIAASLFLKPGFNDIPQDLADQVRQAISEYVEDGTLEVVGETDDPFRGSVEKVVTAVKETWDRDLLEEVRKTAKSRKVKDAVDAQLKRITDHREAS